MKNKVNHLFDEALALSVNERAELLRMLSENLALTDDFSISQKWQEEIKQRKVAYKNGESKALPWNEVKARFLAL
jgi:putative addiction module component (TIGR02574 family)